VLGEKIESHFQGSLNSSNPKSLGKQYGGPVLSATDLSDTDAYLPSIKEKSKKKP